MKPRFGQDLKRKDQSGMGNTIIFVLNQNSRPRFVVPWIEYDKMEQMVSEFWNTKHTVALDGDGVCGILNECKIDT